MVTVLALGAALAYGVADFLGGAVARKSTALRALTWCVPVGLLVVLVSALLSGGDAAPGPMALGFLGGLSGGAGLITFYRALARGPMSVVAPVSALAAAILPVGVGVLQGERLDASVIAGVLLCLIAIGLVSMEPGPTPATGPDTPPGAGAASGADAPSGANAPPSADAPPGTNATPRAGVALGANAPLAADVPPGADALPGADVAPGAGDVVPSAGVAAVGSQPSADVAVGAESGAGVAVGAGSGAGVLLGADGWRRLLDSGPLMAGLSGACFGIFFVLLKAAGDGTGLWPIVGARVGTLTVVVVALLVVAVRGSGLGPRVSGRTLIGLALLSGTLDAGANALYFLAAHKGMLSLAAVLTSLYPAITVLLARIAYSERLRVVQRVGMAVAVAGVALVTVG
ncbi:EamA family transporter [Actinomadura sp. 1N219]|uniref:EamA family transporter n=1 Tax=Actinomadura sp. 1N219 TaxID=3375152 RepID=UPI0037BA8959